MLLHSCVADKGHSVFALSRHYLLIDNFLNTQYSSVRQCIKIVRRIYVMITPGSQRVNN